MKPILPIIDDPAKDDESFFPLFPEMIRLPRVSVRMRTVFNSLQDPGQKRTSQERIKTLSLTEVVELQGSVPIVNSDAGS